VGSAERLVVTLLVVADDLTGALDTAVQLAAYGTGVLVTSGTAETPEEHLARVPVWVADTNTRHRDPTQAFRAVAECISRGVHLGATCFYKKTDSTLRGNVGAELDAAMSAAGSEFLVFAPALPVSGRTTESGIQYIHGVPLSETEFARDALNPVHESRVDRIVASQCQRPVFTMVPGDVPAEKRGIAVYDAASEADLAAVAESYRGSAVIAFAGCAGFARYLPLLADLPQRRTKPFEPTRKLLVVCGSRNSVSLKQVAHAEAHGVPTLRLPHGTIGEPQGTALQGFLREAVRVATDRDTVVVAAPPPSPSHAARGSSSSAGLESHGQHGGSGYEAATESAGLRADRVAGALAAVARRLVEEARVDGVAVFGGDTLRHLMRALEVDALEPLLEIAPGVVVSRPLGVAAPAWFVSKAGGFGLDDVIRQIRRFMLAGGNS
jgi:uncharacterized protein YgbK (DUF1537 family)